MMLNMTYEHLRQELNEVNELFCMIWIIFERMFYDLLNMRLELLYDYDEFEKHDNYFEKQQKSYEHEKKWLNLQKRDDECYYELI